MSVQHTCGQLEALSGRLGLDIARMADMAERGVPVGELAKSLRLEVAAIDRTLGKLVKPSKAATRAHYEAEAAKATQCEACASPDVVSGPSGRICVSCDFAQGEAV